MNQELLEAIKRQPPGIIEGVVGAFKFFERCGMPPLDPKEIFVVCAHRHAAGVVELQVIAFDEMKTSFESPVDGDPDRIPGLLQARAELIEKITCGATEGVILWVQDHEQNFFLLPIGRVPLPDVNAKGGSA